MLELQPDRPRLLSGDNQSHEAQARLVYEYLRRERALRGLTRIIEGGRLSPSDTLLTLARLETAGHVIRSYWKGSRVWCLKEATPDSMALLPGYSSEHAYAPVGQVAFCTDGREDKYSKSILELTFEHLRPNSVYIDGAERTAEAHDIECLRFEFMGDQERMLLRDMLQSAITMLEGKKPKISTRKVLGRIEPSV